MARQQSKSNRNSTKEKSLADYISSANKRLVTLARSKYASDRLRGINVSIFILVLGFIITHFFIYPATLWSLGGLIFLLLSLVVSLIIGAYGYASFLSMFVKPTDNEISSLRIGAIILLVAYPFAFAGLTFGNQILIYLAFGIIAIQAMVLFFFSIFPLPTSTGRNKHYGQRVFEGNIGTFSLAISILDIVVTLVSIIMTVIPH